MNKSGLISFRIDWFDLLAVQGTFKSLLQHHDLKASVLLHSAFFVVRLSYLSMAAWKTIDLINSVYISTPISQFPSFPLGIHTFVFYICISISALLTCLFGVETNLHLSIPLQRCGKAHDPASGRRRCALCLLLHPMTVRENVWHGETLLLQTWPVYKFNFRIKQRKNSWAFYVHFS